MIRALKYQTIQKSLLCISVNNRSIHKVRKLFYTMHEPKQTCEELPHLRKCDNHSYRGFPSLWVTPICVLKFICRPVGSLQMWEPSASICIFRSDFLATDAAKNKQIKLWVTQGIHSLQRFTVSVFSHRLIIPYLANLAVFWSYFLNFVVMMPYFYKRLVGDQPPVDNWCLVFFNWLTVSVTMYLLSSWAFKT